MKRPKKITKWFRIDSIISSFVDWNNKKSRNYFIKIPYWLARAYIRGNMPYVKITFYDKVPCANKRRKTSTIKPFNDYFKNNWSKKVKKMRKLNNGYMEVKSTWIKLER